MQNQYRRDLIDNFPVFGPGDSRGVEMTVRFGSGETFVP